MSSPNDAQMRSVIKNFLGLLKYTTMVKSEFGHTNAVRFYKAAYELGRHMHLRPDYRPLFTEEDTATFRKWFKPAFISIAQGTDRLINNLEPHELNLAKKRLSQIWFLLNEIYGLYQELFEKVEPIVSMEIAAIELDPDVQRLESKIEFWSDSDNECYTEPNPNEEPNLNGVPDSHYWWSKIRRQAWKDKAEQ